MDVQTKGFECGDRVRAEYGGPVMVVEEVYEHLFLYRFRCRWVGRDGQPRRDLFRAEQLYPVRDATPDG